MKRSKRLSKWAVESIREWKSLDQGCSCHVVAPCSSCTDFRNPINIKEDEEAWVSYDVHRHHSDTRWVYMAGPYRGTTYDATKGHIMKARDHALDINRNGGFAITPHLLCGLFDYEPGLTDAELVPDGHAYWLSNLLDLLLTCDCVYAYSGEEASTGTAAEVRLAKALDIPVFTTIEQVAQYCKENKND